MIAVVLAQLAARWGQALTLLALSLAATLAAVSASAYAVAIDRAALENELAAASSSERVVSFPDLFIDSPTPQAEPGAPENLGTYAEVRAGLTGLVPIDTSSIQVQGLVDDAAADPHRLLARDGFCRQVEFTAGRCPVGSREVALPASLAEANDVSAGSELVLAPVRRVDEEWAADGPPTPLVAIGVFEPRDPADPYWAPRDPLGEQGFTPAILTNSTVVRTIPHGAEAVYVDAILPTGGITPAQVPKLRRQLERAEDELAGADFSGFGLTTDLPVLLDRITAHGEQARALLPIAAAPLVVLCWFVIFLAVGHGVSGRRHEAGVVALRGARWRTRAATIAAESLLPLLVGVPVGFAAAHLLIAVAGPSGSGGGGAGAVAIDRTQLIAAGLAAAGTVVAGIVALRGELAAPVAQLLRRVPPRSRRLAIPAATVLMVALGAVVVAQLRALDGELVGVMVAGPVVIMLAVTALAALAIGPLLVKGGQWSLNRGRLGPTLGALYLARRPGSARMLVVLALVLGTLGFAAAGTDVAARGRVAEAQRLLGAPRVLEIQDVDRSELLSAVRAADPEGEHAMAMVTGRRAADKPPVIAVDSERFAAVAEWSERYGSTTPAKVAQLLRPPAPDPVVVEDGELVAELTIDPLTPDDTLTLTLLLAPTDGGSRTVTFGPVTEADRAYTANVRGCEDGCRLAGMSVSLSGEASSLGVTLHSLQLDGTDVIPPERLGHPDWWRSPEEGTVVAQVFVEALDDGLMLTHRQPVEDEEYDLLAVDVPYPLPAVTAGRPAGDLLTSIDDQLIRYDAKTNLTGLPGIGDSGILLDLEYAERLATASGIAASPQVWLSADAPESVVDRLRDEGLVIAADNTITDLQTAINESGAAMALEFYRVAVGAAVLVGLGALALVIAVDRRTWSRGLRDLRTQGLTERTTVAAAVWSYGGIVIAGAVTGVLAAAAAWLGAGERLPLGVDASLLASMPRPMPVLVALAAVFVVFLVAAVGGARWQQRSPARSVRTEALEEG